MDPDSGETPPEGGAPAAGRAETKSSPRKRGKRRRGKRASPPVSDGAAASAPYDGKRADGKRAGDLEPGQRRGKRQGRPAAAPDAALAEHRAKTRGDAGSGPDPARHKRSRHPASRPLPEIEQFQQKWEPVLRPELRDTNEQFQQKWEPVLRPELRGNKETGRFRDAVSTGNAPAGGGARSASPPAARPPIERPRGPGPGPNASADAPHGEEFYAALDLGTNNCRLLVAQPTRPGHFRVVDAFSRIVRLGEGFGASRRLSPQAMDRAVEALRICAAKLRQHPIRRMRLIATEACRSAENGSDFLARVIRETGLALEVIDRETEARLAVSGCSSLVGRGVRSVVLFDIGGGSSEIAVIRIGDNRSGRLANHITHWTSLPVGVVTLSERHGGREVTPAIFAAMVAEVEAMLNSFEAPPLSELRPAGPEDFHLIGTSGTVTTLAGVFLDLPRYDRRRVDGLWLTDAEVDAMQERLLSWDFAGRAANPCIGPDRADLVLAGCAILEAIRRRWPSPRMRVADRGLREGILTEMMADDGVWRRPRRPRGDIREVRRP